MKTHLLCSGNILKNCSLGLMVRRAEHGEHKKRGKEMHARMLNQGIEWAGKDRRECWQNGRLLGICTTTGNLSLLKSSIGDERLPSELGTLAEDPFPCRR